MPTPIVPKFKNYVGSSIAAIAAVLSFIDLKVGPTLYVVLALVAVRYLFTAISGRNPSSIFQDLATYSIVVAGSYIGQGAILGNGLPLVHVVLAALVLHEASYVVPLLTSFFKNIGLSATVATKDAEIIVGTIETDLESAKITKTGLANKE